MKYGSKNKNYPKDLGNNNEKDIGMNGMSTNRTNPILIGMLAVFVSNIGHASALEQSGQSILPFLENGNYAEANFLQLIHLFLA